MTLAYVKKQMLIRAFYTKLAERGGRNVVIVIQVEGAAEIEHQVLEGHTELVNDFIFH